MGEGARAPARSRDRPGGPRRAEHRAEEPLPRRAPGDLGSRAPSAHAACGDHGAGRPAGAHRGGPHSERRGGGEALVRAGHPRPEGHRALMNRRNPSSRGERQCPALFIAAMASGQGKTTVTAALARYHAREGRRVRVFKAGPDFLDPKILEAVSGSAVLNLDCWMVGVEASRALLSQASRSADLILVEGAMGLYDGDPSGADLAKTFGVPIAAVIDASAMAQTFGAVAHGLQTYRRVPFAGGIAKRVASEGHPAMLAARLKPRPALIAGLPGLRGRLAERHLRVLPA